MTDDKTIWLGYMTSYDTGVMRHVIATDRETCQEKLASRCDCDGEWQQNEHEETTWNIEDGSTTLVVTERELHS